MLLLSDDPERLFDELRGNLGANMAEAARPSDGGLPLLEHLLRALHGSPGKVDQVGRLIEDLGRTPEGQALLPPELNAIWGPIARARSRQQANQPQGDAP
jgi:hypothetical protein